MFHHFCPFNHSARLVKRGKHKGMFFCESCADWYTPDQITNIGRDKDTMVDQVDLKSRGE